GWLRKIWLLLPFALTVWLIMQATALVAINTHRTITVVAVIWTTRCVHWYLRVIHTQTVALGVPIGEQSSLQHAVWRETYTWHNVRWVKGRLLNIGKIILRIFIQFKITHFNQWIVTFWPHFSQIKRVIRHFSCIGFWHDLHIHGPAREITALNRFIQVTLRAFTVFPNQISSFLVSQIFNALLSFKVEFHPITLISRVNKAKGVRTKTMHMAIGGRNTAVTHYNSDLV